MSKLDCISEIKSITDQAIINLNSCIENNLLNKDDDEDDDDTTDVKVDGLTYKITGSSPKEKFIAALQKTAIALVELTSSLESVSRSNMIHKIRSLSDIVTAMNIEATQITGPIPDGKSKFKFLEHTSKLKVSCVQLKINISVRASSSEDDDVKELDSKILGLYQQIGECYTVITESDRIFTDLDFNQQSFTSTTGSGSSTWNNINW
eukprot:gene637-790_t